MRMGIDLGGTNLKLGLFDNDGGPHSFRSTPVSGLGGDKGLWNAICNYIEGFRKDVELTSAGLSIKGLVSADGVLCDDIGLAGLFQGMNLKQDLEARLRVPVTVANDARSYGWGEYCFGAGRGCTIMVCITLGTGIGCSIVANGKPWMGKDPTSGILGGHITLDRNGPECLCGNRGCFEGYCSATAFRSRILGQHPGLMDSEDVIVAFFEHFRNDPATYQNVLHEWTDDLALGIVSLVHTTGADLVVIGGGLTGSSDLFMPRLREIVHKRAWTWPRGTVNIETSKLGNMAAALGAAFLNDIDNHL